MSSIVVRIREYYTGASRYRLSGLARHKARCIVSRAGKVSPAFKSFAALGGAIRRPVGSPCPVRPYYRWRARPAPQKEEAGPWMSAAIAKRMNSAPPAISVIRSEIRLASSLPPMTAMPVQMP